MLLALSSPLKSWNKKTCFLYVSGNLNAELSADAAQNAAQKMVDSMQTMSAATPPALPPVRRRVFRVALSAHAPSEINFKELLARSLAAAADDGAQPAERDAGLPPTVQPSLSAPAPPSQPAAPALAGPRSQRYNIIERLEKRYGGGAVVDCSESADGGGGRGGDEDDYYDSEDSFIDDEELQQNIEEIHGQARVKTKHAGFFVNAGDEIETLERDDKFVCVCVCVWRRTAAGETRER